jgi:DNA-binding NarL/FixJ family response regulator
MGGEETIRELRKLDPNVKAILSSGSYGLPILARYREYGFCHALPKPYGMEDMEQALREVLCPQEASSGSRA